MGMDLRLVVYAPNGASLGVLPAPSGFSGSLVLSDVGALTLEYAADAPRASLLAGACELALEYVTSVEITDEVSDYVDLYGDTYPAVTTVTVTPAGAWTEPLDCRFIVLRDSGDEIKRPGVVSYEAPGIGWRLSKAIVLPDGLRPDGKRAFPAATPGSILRTLLNEATNRGALAGMDFTSFTSVQDSSGASWAHTITIYYTPGIDLLQVLRNLSEQGMCDFAFQGRSLRVWNPDATRSRDLTAAASQVELARARDLQEASYAGTREGIASWAFLQGDVGVSISVGNSQAEQQWGRWEDFYAEGGVRDFGTLVALAEANIARSERRREQRTYGLAFDRARHLPFRDYTCGDYVWARTGGTPVKVRVRQITLGRTATGVVTGSAVLNDRFLEADVKLARAIDGITNGARSGGTGGQIEQPGPEGADTMPPAAVTNVITTTAAYLDSTGAARAQVSVSWDVVTLNADATAADDIDHYEVWQRPNLTGIPFSLMTVVAAPDVSVDSSPYDAGSVWQFKVRAVDRANNRGAFSLTVTRTMAVDGTAPAAPSAPTLTTRLGQITVRWDGRNDVGGFPPADLSHVEVHVSLSSGFTPSPATYAGRMGRGADSLVLTNLGYSVPYYVKLIAVDFSGNGSVPSAQATATVQPLVNTDFIGAIINGANIVNGSINAADKVIGNTITGGLIQSLAVNTGHLAANAITADKIDAGAVTAEAIAANAVGAEQVRIGSLPPTVLNNGLSGNLVPDPGFEDDTWRTDRLAQNTAARPGSTLAFTQATLDGNLTWRAQLVSRNGSGVAPAVYVIDPLPLTPARKLYGGFRVAEDGAANGAVIMYATVSFPTGPASTLTVASSSGVTTDDGLWHYVSGTVDIPANAVSAQVYVSCDSTWTTGTWTVDDVEVREVIGAPGQQRRVEISPTGFYAFDPLPGEDMASQEPVIALGTGTSDFLVLTDQDRKPVASISREGYASFVDGSFDNWPMIKGRDLGDEVDARPRGVVEWSRLSNSSPATNTEQGMVEQGAFVVPGRMYRIHTSPIRLLGESTGDHQAGIRLRWTFTNNAYPAAAPRPLLTSPPIGEALTAKFDGLTGASVVINRIVNFNQARHIRMLLSVFMATGPSAVYIYGNDSNWPVEWWLEDMGWFRPPAGAVSDGSSGSPEPIVGGTFERQYVATWTQTFKGWGELRTDTTDAVQGYHSSNGDQGAQIGFPTTLMSDLAGATVENVQVYLYANHWHSNSGGTAIIGSHGNVSPPFAFTGALTNRSGSAGWPKPGGRWVDITAWASVGVKDGTIRGITLGRAGSTSTAYYGRFNGAGQANPPQLYVKYRK